MATQTSTNQSTGGPSSSTDPIVASQHCFPASYEGSSDDDSSASSSEGGADSDVGRIGQAEGGEASDTVGSGDESTAVQEEMHAALRSGDLGCVVCLKEQ